VGRLNFETTEESLSKAFESYGPITKAWVVIGKNGKSRGYGFVEFKHSWDADGAYRKGNGKRVDGNRIITDWEKGRTDKEWIPRRLGGGVGDSRYNDEEYRLQRKVIKDLKEEERSLKKREKKELVKAEEVVGDTKSHLKEPSAAKSLSKDEKHEDGDRASSGKSNHDSRHDRKHKKHKKEKKRRHRKHSYSSSRERHHKRSKHDDDEEEEGEFRE
jgi:U1 small nuclear ribonucleoprotein